MRREYAVTSDLVMSDKLASSLAYACLSRLGFSYAKRATAVTPYKVLSADRSGVVVL